MSVHSNFEGKDIPIRVLKESEIPEATLMFADIFQNDALYRALFRENGEFPIALRKYFEVMLKIGVKHHQVFIAGDYLGGAIFFPPTVTHISILEQLALLKDAIKIFSFRKLIPSLVDANFLESETPNNLHYYLFAVGHRLDPNLSHHGIARALVTPTLKECDRIQVPCYTEFTSEGSARWGEKLGFKVFKELNLPIHNEVIVRLAMRDPQPL